MNPSTIGFDYEASCRRIRGTFRGDKVDHVPIIPPIYWDPSKNIDDDNDRKGKPYWYGEERFRMLARMVQSYCDPLLPYNKVGFPTVFEPHHRVFLEAPSDYSKTLPEVRISETRTQHTTLLHTPRGDLRWVYEKERDSTATPVEREWPVKSEADIDKLLSVPYRFRPPTASKFAPFREHRRAMGRNAISGACVNSVVAMLSASIQPVLMLEWTLTRPDLITRVADAWLARTAEKVDWLLSQGVGPYWRLCGFDFAAPPFMGPETRDSLVVPYDGEIIRRIKSADSEAIIHVHCHGKVRTLLDSFVKMGAHATDPVEPPRADDPSKGGDADFAEVAKSYGDKLVLFGNIELWDMMQKDPDEIERMVQHALCVTGRKKFILMPSFSPVERPTDRFLANAKRYIEAGLRYGAQPSG